MNKAIDNSAQSTPPGFKPCDLAASAEIDRLTSLVADMFEVRAAVIVGNHAGRAHVLSASGLPKRLKQSPPLAKALVEQDAKAITDGAGFDVEFSAEAPIGVADDGRYGRLHLLDDKPRELTGALKRNLAGFAAQAAALLGLSERCETAEALFQETIDNLPVSVAQFDQDDRLVACNTRFRAFSSWMDNLEPGLTYEHILRRAVDADFFPDASRDPDIWLTNKLDEHRREVSVSEQQIVGDEWVRFIERRTATGGAACCIVDISEIKRQQHRLVEAHAKLDKAHHTLLNAVEALPEAFARYDSRRKLAICNDRFRDYFPWVDEMSPGATFAELLSTGVDLGHFPEVEDDPEEWMRILLTIHHIGDVAIEQQIGDRWIRLSQRREPSGGTAIIGSDITELKRQQQELESANVKIAKQSTVLKDTISALPEAFSIYDAEDRLVCCNDQLREFCSWIDLEPGMKFQEIIEAGVAAGAFPAAEDDRDGWLERRMALHRAGKVTLELQRGADWFKVSERLTSDGGVALICANITELKRHQMELESLNAALAAANATLEERVALRTQQVSEHAMALEAALSRQQEINSLQRRFVSMVSHEFRTPLSIIDAAARRLGRKFNEQGGEGYVSRIAAAVLRLTGLIESVLQATKLQEGKIEMFPEDVDPTRLVLEACENQQSVSSRHTFDVDVSDGADIVGDPRLIYQIIVNLVSNAAKYSPDGSTVTVRCTHDADGVAISVADQGVGIPPEEIGSLFQNFFRASTSTGIVGTGLGLSLSREFAKMHGADIQVTSELNVGSTFTLKLPYAPCPADEAAA